MRHQVKRTKLNMDNAQRDSVVLNLCKSLIASESVETTLRKAKFVRPVLEKLITKARSADLSTRRLLLGKLRDKASVKKMLEDLGPRFKDRNGGYLRIRRTSVRVGDNTQLARIEFVEKSKTKAKLSEKVVVKKEASVDTEVVKPVEKKAPKKVATKKVEKKIVEKKK